MKKIVITPGVNSLIEETIYTNGRKSLKVIKKWKRCVILTEKIPRSRTVDNLKTTTFKSLRFLENAYDYRRSVDFSSNLTDTDKRKLRRLVTSPYKLEEQGWTSKKSKYKLTGDFRDVSVPIRKLTLYTSTVEFAQRVITKQDYDRYVQEGITQSEYENAVIKSGPFFDSVSLEIDGIHSDKFTEYLIEKYTQLNIENAQTALSRREQFFPKDARYALIGESWTKRSWYDLTIYEEFDESQISVSVSAIPIFGVGAFIETFTIFYNGKEFEFSGGHGSDGPDIRVVNVYGDEKSVDYYDDDIEDEDEDEDEDN